MAPRQLPQEAPTRALGNLPQRPCALLQNPCGQPPSALQQPFPGASSSGLPCPRKDLASTFHNEATFCFSPSLLLHRTAVALAAARPQ